MLLTRLWRICKVRFTYKNDIWYYWRMSDGSIYREVVKKEANVQPSSNS